MSKEIEFKRRAFYIKGTKQRLRGLHRVLQERFYPLGSTYDNTRINAFYKKKGAKTIQVARRDLPKSDKEAKKFGNKIDKQIEKLVKRAFEQQRSVKEASSVLRRWVGLQDPLQTVLSDSKVKAPVKEVHPFATAGIRELLQHGLVPARCQVVVGSTQHGVATKADIECRYEKNPERKAIVEFKTGYEQTWDCGTGQFLLPPLSKVPDTQCNKAHLQALCTAILYRHYQNEKRDPDVYVLRVCKATGATLQQLPQEMQSNTQKIAIALCQKEKRE